MIRPPRNTYAAAALVAMAAAIPSVAGCGGDGEGEEETARESASEPARESAGAKPEVQIKDFKFVPPDIEVNAGTTIRWTNEDDASHTASADERGSFDTGTIKTGQTKSATLREPGTFAYICDFHPFMKGQITVR